MTGQLNVRQRHYLALLGVDHFVRREQVAAPAATVEPEAGIEQPPGVERSPADTPETGGRAQVSDARAAENPAGYLADMQGATEAPERESAAKEQLVAPPPNPAPAEIPSFRLLLLEASGGLLLANLESLEQERDGGHQLQRLGDLLRAAVLLRQGQAPETLARSEFFWPQVDDPGLDQSLYRAQQALHYYLTRRPEAEPPLFVLRVHSEQGDTDADRMLHGLMLEDVPLVDVADAALQGARSMQPLWDRLQGLWRPD